MAASCLTTKPLNPNANPWLHFLPYQIIQTPSADVAPVFVPVHYGPTAVVPYYFHVSPPLYHRFVYVYPAMAPPAVVVQSPPQVIDGSAYSGGLCRRRSAMRKRPFKTTLMIRNIPNHFSRHMLVDFLDQVCAAQNAGMKFQARRAPFEYDFLYLPMDFMRGNNLGYSFVNFTTPYVANKIGQLLSGYKWGTFEDSNGNHCESKKVCEVDWANIQGKNDLVNHFKNSRFVCNNIEYLPVLFSPPRDGATSPIPPKTVGQLSGCLLNPTGPRRLSISPFSSSDDV